MSGGSVYLSAPPRSLFKFPPDAQPYALPPPKGDPWVKAPFHINPDFYQAVLRPQVPITFALCYIAAVLSLNAFNRSRNWKPWSFSKTRIFTPLVVAHNLALAIFSAATFAAMVRAVYLTWPEMNFDTTPADIADALCKINGPRGLGDAVTYDALTSTWSSKNAIIKLAGSLPDNTDVGRLWNEGLAFWGWTFYLSKFYEVVDTLVILARGKRSPTLQTYHHAGAMLCMWAGMRWMSPPIWMFVFLNSFIHTLMYVYYTLAALRVKVPTRVKQTLTTMQIMQFVVGSTLAAFHLFIRYDIPVNTAYTVITPIASAASAASSVVSSLVNDPPSVTSLVASAASAVSAATASPSLAAVIKRLLLRAAGGEGAAENVRDSSNHIALAGEETRYRTSYATVDCIDTTGQSFAIWLNLIYLAPLTVLFLRFFVKAYITGTLGKGKQRRRSFTEATAQAVRQTKQEAEHAGAEVERRLSEQVRRDIKDMRDGKFAETPSKATNGAKPSTPKAAESAIEDSGDEEDKSEPGEKSELEGTPTATPDKKKKKRNRKKNKGSAGVHDAAHAGVVV
ncbi:hypothetical protein ANO11243_054930 [Dothideomycetidae sp. 11243]|nr:hypothetical protein ANO11243_054930 [fungal sp. No.11243]